MSRKKVWIIVSIVLAIIILLGIGLWMIYGMQDSSMANQSQLTDHGVKGHHDKMSGGKGHRGHFGPGGHGILGMLVHLILFVLAVAIVFIGYKWFTRKYEIVKKTEPSAPQKDDSSNLQA